MNVACKYEDAAWSRSPELPAALRARYALCSGCCEEAGYELHTISNEATRGWGLVEQILFIHMWFTGKLRGASFDLGDDAFLDLSDTSNGGFGTMRVITCHIPQRLASVIFLEIDLYLDIRIHFDCFPDFKSFFDLGSGNFLELSDLPGML